MGDKNHRLVLTGLYEVMDERLLSIHIQAAAELIEQEDAAGAEQTAGDGDTLCLTFAQALAIFAADRLQTHIQISDKIGGCTVQSLVHLLLGGIGIAQKQILAQLIILGF